MKLLLQLTVLIGLMISSFAMAQDDLSDYANDPLGAVH